jgi:hypothetical protein
MRGPQAHRAVGGELFRRQDRLDFLDRALAK